MNYPGLKRCIVFKEQHKSTVSVHQYLQVRYQNASVNQSNSLLLDRVLTNKSLDFNAYDIMGERDDMGDACLCSVLKRVCFGQYINELTCVYDESAVYPNQHGFCQQMQQQVQRYNISNEIYFGQS